MPAGGGNLLRAVYRPFGGWRFSAELVLACVVGGTRHFWGPVLGALVVVVLTEIALRFALHHGAVLGALLVVVAVAFPGGVAGTASLVAARLRPLSGITRRARG